MTTYNIEGEGSVLVPGDDIAPVRAMDKYITWIRNEFKPLTLITPLTSLEQCVENAIRYFNTHSAYKVSSLADFNTSSVRVQLAADFKSVVEVIPSTSTTWIWNDHPLWTMLGITVLDSVTSDLIMMSEAFRNYRIYVGSDMRWWFEKSEDPTIGGWLYVINLPRGTASVFVTGTKRIVKEEDIKQEFILEWILRYSRSLVKVIEGNTLRKSSIININNDGQSLIGEGKEEIKALQEELARNGRWVTFAKRA